MVKALLNVTLRILSQETATTFKSGLLLEIVVSADLRGWWSDNLLSRTNFVAFCSGECQTGNLQGHVVVASPATLHNCVARRKAQGTSMFHSMMSV